MWYVERSEYKRRRCDLSSSAFKTTDKTKGVPVSQALPITASLRSKNRITKQNTRVAAQGEGR